jgi:hypothetical protein
MPMGSLAVWSILLTFEIFFKYSMEVILPWPDRTHQRVMTCYPSCRTVVTRSVHNVRRLRPVPSDHLSQSGTKEACHDGHDADTVASFICLFTLLPCRPIAPSLASDLSYSAEDS